MRYRYLDDFRRGISLFAIFSYRTAVLGTPQCPPPVDLGTVNPLLNPPPRGGLSISSPFEGGALIEMGGLFN